MGTSGPGKCGDYNSYKFRQCTANPDDGGNGLALCRPP